MKRPAFQPLCLLALLAACSGGEPRPKDPVIRAFRPDLRVATRPGAIDWAAPVLLRVAGLDLDRAGFESYLCQRYATTWLQDRAVIAVLRAPAPDQPGWLDEKAVMEQRRRLAPALGLEEKVLRRQLLGLRWGEPRLLDRLRARMLVQRSEGVAAKVLPGRLADLMEDALSRAVVARARRITDLRFALDRRDGHPERLVTGEGRTLVDLAGPVLLDTLGVITPTERVRALREYAHLRLAERALGGVRPTLSPTAPDRNEAAPAQAWLNRMVESYLAGLKKPAPSWLSGAAEELARVQVKGHFHLVPALREASGRAGTFADLRKAEKKADALARKLAGGEPPEPPEVDSRLPSTLLFHCRRVRALTGRWVGVMDLHAALEGGGMAGLGLAAEPGMATILTVPQGQWRVVPTWFGPVVLRIEDRRHTQASPAYRRKVLGRIRFLHWIRGLTRAG